MNGNDPQVCMGCQKTATVETTRIISGRILCLACAGVSLDQHSRDTALPVETAGDPCPVCGSRQLAERRHKGSLLIGVLLLLAAIIPGLIYFAAFYRTVYACPDCGAKRGEMA